MSRGDKGKKMVSLSKKRDAANLDRATIKNEAECCISKLARMEALGGDKWTSYESQNPQNKKAVNNKMKSIVNKLMRKDKPKKRRTAPSPIVGAALKFHQEDDEEPAAAGGAA